MIICCTIPEIWRRMDVIFSFHFGLFFALLTPLQSEKSKLKKKMKIKRPEISSFYPCAPKFMLTWCIQKLWSHGVRFLRYDKQETDGQKKWNIGVGAPPKNHKTKTQYLFNRHCFLRQIREEQDSFIFWANMEQNSRINWIFHNLLKSMSETNKSFKLNIKLINTNPTFLK